MLSFKARKVPATFKETRIISFCVLTLIGLTIVSFGIFQIASLSNETLFAIRSIFVLLVGNIVMMFLIMYKLYQILYTEAGSVPIDTGMLQKMSGTL